MLQMVVGLLCHAGWGVPMYNWKKKKKKTKKGLCTIGKNKN